MNWIGIIILLAGLFCVKSAQAGLLCKPWPTAQKFSCSGGGGWKELNGAVKLKSKDMAACELLCKKEDSGGCCEVSDKWGCYYKPKGVVSTGGPLDKFLSIACSSAPETKAPSLDRFTSAKKTLKQVIESKKRSILPILVRLAFHDCVGPKGCDGCLNLKNPDNGGLEGIVKTLGEVRKGNFGPGVPPHTDISNADFWQIAGIAALELASDNVLKIEFKGGRVDCPTSPSTEEHHEFPGPSMSRNVMMKWFKDSPSGFGMTENQVTALMGAHALGGAKPENSGYKGQWTPPSPNTFNNDYYRRLLIPSWTFKSEAITSNGKTKFQWESSVGGSDKCMMLNTDVELVFDLNVDGNGKALCEPDMNAVNGCKVATATNAKVNEYFGSQDLFFKDFKVAYELMMTAKITAPLKVPQMEA